MVGGVVESGEEGHGTSGLIWSCSPKGANFTLLRCRVMYSPFSQITWTTPLGRSFVIVAGP